MENLIEDESSNNSDGSSDSIYLENKTDLFWKTILKKNYFFGKQLFFKH